MSVEEIAARQNISPIFVRRSLDTMQEFRGLTSNEMVQMKANELVIAALGEAGTVLKGAMKATRVVHVSKQGKIKTAPDHKTRLNALASVKSLAEISQPKGPGIQLNQQFNNADSPSRAQRPGMSFEARVRMLRERRGMRNDDNVDVPTAEQVENNIQTAEEELADIGIDLSEDDEEGDDAGAEEES